MRPVIVAGAVERAVVVRREVPAGHIVDEPVVIVIDAVGDFTRVRPHVAGEVRMRAHDAFVDDADVDIGAADVPGLPRLAGLAAIWIRRRARITVHPPQRSVRVVRVVRVLVVINPIGLGKEHR
jgi:hypothetical protein